MRIANDQKATVFEVKENEKRKNTMMATLSTYEGKDKGGNNVFSSWRGFFVGDAYEKAKQLKDKDKIILTASKVDNNYDKTKKALYLTLTIFDFDIVQNPEAEASTEE